MHVLGYPGNPVGLENLGVITMKPGTKIIVALNVWTNGIRKTEGATVIPTKQSMLPMPDGFVPVRFDDGSRLLVHSSYITIA